MEDNGQKAMGVGLTLLRVLKKMGLAKVTLATGLLWPLVTYLLIANVFKVAKLLWPSKMLIKALRSI